MAEPAPATTAWQRPRKRRAPKKSRVGLVCLLLALLLTGGFGGYVWYLQPHVSGDPIRFDSFVDLAERGKVLDATILDGDSYVVGRYVKADGSTGTYSSAYLRAADARGTLLRILLDQRVPTSIEQQVFKALTVPVTILFTTLVTVVATIYIWVSWRRGSGMFGAKSGARKIVLDDSPVAFSDVAGQEAAVAELRDIKGFLTDPARFGRMGAQVPKGILLFGPPGCGKTLLARAIATEAGASFYSITGSDFVEMYVGVGAARVRDLFREARENAPATIFIDEIDVLGRRRGGSGSARTGSSEEQEQALNQLFTEMDGFSPLEAGILVIGATNRPDALDPALLRPGRFDRTIGLERPDEGGRLAVLGVHAKGKPLEPGVDLAALARRSVGLSGADLANVMNEGVLLAIRSGKATVGQAELDAALTRVLEAPELQRRLSQRQRGFGRASTAEDRVTFADVAGVDDVITELSDIKAYLADREVFARTGARPPRGYLLTGPPGCGKTLLARALAAETNAVFFSVAATEFAEVYVGEGAGRVRDLFAEARTLAPSILFIDEIDAVGARRSNSPDSSREMENTLNQILIELDGFGPRAGVVVMAASNRPDLLDPALIRPGRFDRTIAFDLPDRGARRAILAVHARGKPLAPDVDLDRVAAMTRGYSGADLAGLLNEAALLAARAEMATIPSALVEEGVERMGAAIARAVVLGGDDRKVIAYHEAGHAVVGMRLTGTRPPHKISIVARGRSLGQTWLLDQDVRALLPRSVAIQQMAALLGGRAAEEVVFNEPGSGAADDLRRVGDLARQMVCEWGMSDALGPLGYGTNSSGGAIQVSEEAARLIDSEVRRLVGEAHKLATATLERERGVLDTVARALIERETLSGDELTAMLATPVPQLA